MAKLIGTGKDPRFPKGVDFDVADEDLDHYTAAKLGVPVDPVTEPERIHGGEKLIAEDPSHDEARQTSQEDLGTTSRTAARVETTATTGKEPSASGAVKEAAKGAKAGAKADEKKDEGEDKIKVDKAK